MAWSARPLWVRSTGWAAPCGKRTSFWLAWGAGVSGGGGRAPKVAATRSTAFSTVTSPTITTSMRPVERSGVTRALKSWSLAPAISSRLGKTQRSVAGVEQGGQVAGETPESVASY